jgi:hypothetical protein
MRLATLVVFLAAFFAFAFFFLQLALLYDTDSYYHLAVAQHYRLHGLTPVPWPRFSMLGNGGDKELLFHIFLVPFTALVDPSTGGRIALALLNATLFTLLGHLCAQRLGWWGFAVPLAVWIAAPPFFARAARLRPELGALLIILAAIPLAARKRWMSIGWMCMLFAWSYTAWHVFAAIAAAWVLLAREWKPLGWIAGGTLAGLLIRPHPIGNLAIWWTQNVTLFNPTWRPRLVEEFLPPRPHALLLASGWLLFVIVAAWGRWRADALAVAAAVPATVFALLYAGMSRMAIYAYPLMTVTVVLFAASHRLRTQIALVLAIAIGLPLAAQPQLRELLRGGRANEAEWEQFGRHVPDGAKIAATWGDAEAYALYAPQGRYLNVQDPVFMGVPHPRAFALQESVFNGSCPDVPVALQRGLDSDYLGFDATHASPLLIERVRSEPRLRVVYGGFNVLLHVVPAPVAFELAPSDRCAASERIVSGPATFTFAPYGPSSIVVDGGVMTTGGTLAILSRGLRVDVPPGAHRVVIRTCPARGWNGFYFVERQASSPVVHSGGQARTPVPPQERDEG